MAKQLRTETVITLMLDGAIARYIERHGRHQWVININAAPCGVAIKTLAGRGWLWMMQLDDGFVTAGLNRIGTARGKLGY